MSSIIIESSPISSAGYCRATNNQSIVFTIVSGITSSTVYCEWFLNGNSVYFGSSYILLIPKTNDEVYARVVNCSGETLRIGNWVEDNMFYYNDVKSGTSTYYIDLKASFDYKILSSVFKSNSGDTVQLKIDGTPIIWSGSGNTINISNTIVDTNAISLNNVSIGQQVTLTTTAANVIRGKVRFIRSMRNNRTPLPTPTTTTTTTSTPSIIMYIGALDSAVPGETEIKSSLSGKTSVKSNQSILLNLVTPKRYCFAYPASYGDLLSITSAIVPGAETETISYYNKTTLTMNSILYNVYTLSITTTNTLYTTIFKFFVTNCFQISEQLKYSLYSSTDACSSLSLGTYYGNNSSFASTTTISSNSACTYTLGGFYSNGVIWKFTSNGINFTLSGTCSPPVTTTTTTAVPIYYGYKVNVYVCGSCTLVQSNLIVQDIHDDLFINRYYADTITEYVFRIMDTGQILGGPTSNMVGTPKTSCGTVICV